MNDILLETVNLHKNYGKFSALQGVSLSLRASRITGLLGPNGSGKTTLLKLIAGLLHPSGGEISVCGNPPGVKSKALVSYLPDRQALDPWMKVREAVKYYADFFDDFNLEKADAGIVNLQIDQNNRIKALSKGNREKLNLVLTMSRNAKVFLLDEPIGGVDPAMRDYILNAILGGINSDAALLISTHLIQDVEPVLHDIIFLKQGAVILSGEAEAVRAEKGVSIDALFREMFKC